MIDGFKKAVDRMKYVIEYGCCSNDLSNHDIADEITHVFDELAKKNGEPEINWEEPYEET